jgi:predicted XRE-type DNA-binding protein
MIRTRGRISKVNDIKRQLMWKIRDERKKRRWNQIRMGCAVDLQQGDISAIECEDFCRFTIDRLCMVLIALGHDLAISICQKRLR